MEIDNQRFKNHNTNIYSNVSETWRKILETRHQILNKKKEKKISFTHALVVRTKKGSDRLSLSRAAPRLEDYFPVTVNVIQSWTRLDSPFRLGPRMLKYICVYSSGRAVPLFGHGTMADIASAAANTSLRPVSPTQPALVTRYITAASLALFN